MTGFVYCIQPDGMDLCKIGATKDPVTRGKSIASFSPINGKVVPAGFFEAVERFHRANSEVSS